MDGTASRPDNLCRPCKLPDAGSKSFRLPHKHDGTRAFLTNLPHNGCRLHSFSRSPWEAYSSRDVRQIKRKYTGYRRLLLERKWAHNYMDRPFPFLKLPRELRIQVYKYLLVQEEPIELWPHVINNTTYSSCFYRKAAFARYGDLTPSLRLLRVCSTIHAEASSIFYGENEFRFSGINGWMVLDAFMYTIGPKHFYLLRRLAVHVAFPGEEHLVAPVYSNQTFRERMCDSDTSQHRHFKQFMQRMGLQAPRIWEYDISVTRCTDALSASYNFCTLKLVIPPSYYIYQPCPRLEWYWRRFYGLKCIVDADRQKQGRVPLHIGFVFLKLEDCYLDIRRISASQLSNWWMVRYTGQSKRTLDRLKQTEWISSIEYAVCGKCGNYSTMNRETCEKLTGPMSMRLEHIDEDDWVFGHDGLDWIWA